MTVVERDPIAEPGPWSLEELLPDAGEETLRSRLARLETKVAAFEQRRDELVDSIAATTVLELVEDYEELLGEASRLAGYASLWFASDTQSQAALTFRNRVQQSLTELDNRTLFFSLWWQQLEDGPADALLDELRRRPTAADEVRYLEELRRLRPYRLGEREEQIINLKDADGISGVLTLYSMLTNGLEFRPQIDGACQDGRGLTRDQLMSYVHSTSPEERAAAYQELHRVYREQAPLLAQMYVNRVRDWHNEYLGLRGYSSAIAVRNVANDIPDAAVDTLLEVVREQSALFQRYFRDKAAWLGLDRLRRYDLYAPLAPSSEEVPFAEAVQLVLETFAEFDPRLERLARRVFDQRHLDSEIRPGKKGGAFCATVHPQLTPWVLVNYSGKLRDAAVLAHEMGHALHSMLAEHHSLLTQQPSLPLAETASVFAEILVTDRLLQRHTDPLAQRELLAAAIDDIYATVLRQAYFVLFEQAAHRAILKGRSPDDLHLIYHQNLEEQFGDSVEIAPEFETEWVAIPHIYSTPFYCYSYSFGQLLVLSLYRRFQEEGDGFKPRYLELLAFGGAQRPQQILEGVGVDVTDADFWRGGFAFVEELIDKLAALVPKREPGVESA